MLSYVDTHSHLSDAAFAEDAEEVIARAVAAGVGKMLQADVCSGERGPMRELCARHPGVLYPMAGLYPGSVDSGWEKEVELMEESLGPEVVAVGEIGLDYHYSRETAELQKLALREQLKMAAERDLPVNIHLREATEDFIEVIKDLRHLGLRGNLHAFSLSWESFMEVRRHADFMAGIGGVVTFRNSRLPLAVERIPMELLLLETDAPYLAPVPLRGSRNESANIPMIAECVARIKGLTTEDVAAATTANANRLFKL